MNLNCYYSGYKGDPYMTSHCYHAIVTALEEANPSIVFTKVDNSPMKKAPYMKFGYHSLTIENPNNKKFIAVTFQDKLNTCNEVHGWDMDNCVELFASSGNHIEDYYYRPLNKEVTPFTYPVSTKMAYHTIEEVQGATHTMPTKPSFIGFTYNLREHLSNDDRFDVSNEKVPMDQYIKDLSKNTINLSLNGAGETCQRDMEILGTGTVLFREVLTNQFHNALIPGVHYIGVDCEPIKHIRNHIEYFDAQAELYYEEWQKAINLDRDILETIAENGREWYKSNITPQSHGAIAKEIIDLSKLK